MGHVVLCTKKFLMDMNPVTMLGSDIDTMRVANRMIIEDSEA
jgi:predicted ThiF/HesA family dinucleotide-utilizing enzyme